MEIVRKRFARVCNNSLKDLDPLNNSENCYVEDRIFPKWNELKLIDSHSLNNLIMFRHNYFSR